VFVVDDLVAWLVERLADAGYKKLTKLLRGNEQERALRQAVTAAVQATAGEINPSDKEQADRVAELITNKFRKPVQVKLPSGQSTLLERLRAGIAGQLSVLDEGGQPPVGLVAALADEVADRLTVHLVHEITARGVEGGPLTPLADQLNHDLTHLRGQQAELRGSGSRAC
jgi:hypothetical protein